MAGYAATAIAPYLTISSLLTECHWNGVCALGVNDDTVRRNRNGLGPFRVATRHSFCSMRQVRAMPNTSSSVSPGRPAARVGNTVGGLVAMGCGILHAPFGWLGRFQFWGEG